LHFESMQDALEGVAALSPLPLVALDVDVNQTSFGSFGDVRWNPVFDGQ
jgi:hypothetical protein